MSWYIYAALTDPASMCASSTVKQSWQFLPGTVPTYRLLPIIYLFAFLVVNKWTSISYCDQAACRKRRRWHTAFLASVNQRLIQPCGQIRVRSFPWLVRGPVAAASNRSCCRSSDYCCKAALAVGSVLLTTVLETCCVCQL